MFRNSFNPRPVQRMLLCAALIAIIGCGSDKPLVPVSGRVTYGGGEWPMPGNITFTPQSSGEGGVCRPGSARFDQDGKFMVGSFDANDGLMPGKYHVAISCIDPLDFSKPREELDLVPSTFKADTLIVEAGMDPILLNIDVPKKHGN